jgi:antitoxin ChpS
MTVIELSDEKAAALRAKAAAQGLTLEAWLEKLAGETSVSRSSKGRYSLSGLMAQCDQNAPLSAEDRAWLDAPATGREAWSAVTFSTSI